MLAVVPRSPVSQNENTLKSCKLVVDGTGETVSPIPAALMLEGEGRRWDAKWQGVEIGCTDSRRLGSRAQHRMVLEPQNHRAGLTGSSHLHPHPSLERSLFSTEC